jgi:Spy/CpxP family protein refolding chaperone
MRALFALAAILASTSVLAQDHHPYAGTQQRGIKGLSEEQIADVRGGRGMGLALPAELNGYPGPAHVMENADALGLTADQRARTQALFHAMKAEAVAAGEQIIEQEATLDRLFAEGRVDGTSLAAITREIGLTEGRLRQTHLKYHLAMMDVLSQSQVEEYRKLRGYGNTRNDAQNKHHER